MAGWLQSFFLPSIAAVRHSISSDNRATSSRSGASTAVTSAAASVANLLHQPQCDRRRNYAEDGDAALNYDLD
jgi:hypothetical protein